MYIPRRAHNLLTHIDHKEQEGRKKKKKPNDSLIVNNTSQETRKKKEKKEKKLDKAYTVIVMKHFPPYSDDGIQQATERT